MRPGVNALTAYLGDKLASVFVIEDRLIIQADLEYDDITACCWGMDHELTISAVEAFMERYLNGFVDAALRQAGGEPGRTLAGELLEVGNQLALQLKSPGVPARADLFSQARQVGAVDGKARSQLIRRGEPAVERRDEPRFGGPQRVRLLGQLVQQRFLVRAGEFNVLQITDNGRGVLRGETTPRLVRPQLKAAKRSDPPPESWEGVDRGLFVAPGPSFGPYPSHIRVCFTSAEPAVVKRGIDTLADVLSPKG